MSMEREPRPVSEATLRRLPAYYHFLRGLQERGREAVSCSHIGRELRLDPTQVRKDLEATGIVGRPKVGYDLNALLDAIVTFLGWNNHKDAFLVGAGHLGSALLGYEQIENYGINILAGFDTDPAKIGSVVHGRTIFSLDKLSNLAERMSIHLGIITVPAPVAQSVADLLVDSGIWAIWNFAPVALQVPEGIILQNEDFYRGLAVLSSRIAALSDHAGSFTGRLGKALYTN